MGPSIRRRTKFGPVLLALVGAVAVIAAPLGATGSSNVEPKYVAGESRLCLRGPVLADDREHQRVAARRRVDRPARPACDRVPSGACWTGVSFTISGVSTGDHTSAGRRRTAPAAQGLERDRQGRARRQPLRLRRRRRHLGHRPARPGEQGQALLRAQPDRLLPRGPEAGGAAATAATTSRTASTRSATTTTRTRRLRPRLPWGRRAPRQRQGRRQRLRVRPRLRPGRQPERLQAGQGDDSSHGCDCPVKDDSGDDHGTGDHGTTTLERRTTAREGARTARQAARAGKRKTWDDEHGWKGTELGRRSRRRLERRRRQRQRRQGRRQGRLPSAPPPPPPPPPPRHRRLRHRRRSARPGCPSRSRSATSTRRSSRATTRRPRPASASSRAATSSGAASKFTISNVNTHGPHVRLERRRRTALPLGVDARHRPRRAERAVCSRSAPRSQLPPGCTRRAVEPQARAQVEQHARQEGQATKHGHHKQGLPADQERDVLPRQGGQAAAAADRRPSRRRRRRRDRHDDGDVSRGRPSRRRSRARRSRRP